MILPTTEHIAELFHAELVALVKELIVVVQRLEAENQQLKAELAKGLPHPRRHRTPHSRRHER